MGLAASSRHLLSHAATMVAVTTSMIGGVFVALAVGGLGGGRVPVAVAATAGVLVSVALTAALWRDQARWWRTAEQSVPPSSPCRPDDPSRVQPTAAWSPTTPMSDQATTTHRAQLSNDLNDDEHGSAPTHTALTGNPAEPDLARAY